MPDLVSCKLLPDGKLGFEDGFDIWGAESCCMDDGMSTSSLSSQNVSNHGASLGFCHMVQ